MFIDFFFFFFFSSRRRHTRFDCDWSSDVCSSDLPVEKLMKPDRIAPKSPLTQNLILLSSSKELGKIVSSQEPQAFSQICNSAGEATVVQPSVSQIDRSEERRVGKECRSWR